MLYKIKKNDFKFPQKWEIVYFVTSRCNNNCRHCWSKNNYLGKEIDLEQHRFFFEDLDVGRVANIKLSGGECSLYPFLPELISLIRSYVPNTIPLILFSNGRFLFDASGCIKNVEKAINDLTRNNHIEIHISVDEYHIKCFADSKNVSFEKAVCEYNKCVNRLISFSVKSKNVSVKFKLHCNIGRSVWHREYLFKNIDEKLWKEYFIVTEGLIKAGNAKEIRESTPIVESDLWSAFVLNGVIFENISNSFTRDEYDFQGNTLFLNETDRKGGVVILGWWNLINHKCFGVSIDEFKRLIIK